MPGQSGLRPLDAGGVPDLRRSVVRDPADRKATERRPYPDDCRRPATYACPTRCMNDEPSMNNCENTPAAFMLRFDPLFGVGPALSFLCDAAGRVDLDRLVERARCNYFYARTVIGRRAEA